jgi:SAM-dependent methyltransferase
MIVSEEAVRDFWNSHPCGEHLVGVARHDVLAFFDAYDEYRYTLESHIPVCLDALDLCGKTVLEIGLGQGADSEQIVRRGARWSGLDLTPESVERVRTRFALKGMTFDRLEVGSALAMPFPDVHFDVVFSHGVLHHIPDIHHAQREIRRVLKRDGVLVAMLYAKWSLNYLVAIAILRRLGLLTLMPLPIRLPPLWEAHRKNAREMGIWSYLELKEFIHRNTDGPYNPYSKVYDLRSVANDFPDFTIEKSYKRFMHAPPLPVHGLPGGPLLGWHLWVHLRPRIRGPAF